MAITKVIAAKAPLITKSISMASPNISVRAKMYNGNEVAKTNTLAYEPPHSYVPMNVGNEVAKTYRVAKATPHSYLLMNIMTNATSLNTENTSWPRSN